MLCEYGCGQESKFKIGKKRCCSNSINKCPGKRNRSSISLKSKPRVLCPVCNKTVGSMAFPLHKKTCTIEYCLWCNKEINHNKKFCNSTCAAFYNNKNRIPKFFRISYCKNCGKVIKWMKQFCNGFCHSEYKYKEYISKWKDGKISGNTSGGASTLIRKYILKKYNNKCSVCGWSEVNQFTNLIPLELHHIDGNRFSSIEENLELLCPNHHSLTKNYKFNLKTHRKDPLAQVE